ncbi:MAG: undecaprenyl-diphosphate phosphatase [Thermoguttaceae bacterium]
MEKLIETLILAIVQGIGEFLPISSSGHIIAVNDLFLVCGLSSLPDPVLLGILLHFGTLIAVLVVFWRRIVSLFTSDRRALALILVGTIPAVIIGLPLEKYCKPLLESSLLTGFCFIGTAFLLLYTIKIEKHEPGKLQYRNMSFFDALFIGLFQGIAILPGFSRSGFTIVAGLFRKLKREEAATFSFLLAIPVIGGKGLLEIFKLLKNSGTDKSSDFALLFLGMFASFVVGIISLIWLLKWLKQGKLHYFAYWLFVVGPLVILMAVTSSGRYNTEADDSVNSTQENLVLEKNIPESVTSKTEMSDKATFEGKTQEIITSTTEPVSSEHLLNNSGAEDSVLIETESAETEPTGSKSTEETVSTESDSEPEVILPIERDFLVPATMSLSPEELIKLDENERIWVTKDKKSVVLDAQICLREGFLELFACRRGSKEHESIISTRVTPHLIHAALLVTGAEPGRPAQFSPEFVPPTGPEIEVILIWEDENGKFVQCRAQQLVREIVYDDENNNESENEHGNEGENENARESENEQKPRKEMAVPFVFTGSFFREIEDEDGSKRNVYMADVSGEIFGVSNFPASILDVPIASSDSNDSLLFAPYTERLPELGTPLKVILTPKL